MPEPAKADQGTAGPRQDTANRSPASAPAQVPAVGAPALARAGTTGGRGTATLGSRRARGANGFPDPSVLMSLQRLAGNRAASTLVVQREGNPKVQKAIDEGDPVTIAELPKEEFRTASDDQRFRAVTILLNNQQGGISQVRADAGIPNVWDGFGEGLEAAITQRPAEWERSLKEKRSITASSYQFKGMRVNFFRDVVHVVNGYLDENEHFCKEQLPKLGLDEHGKVIIGPPTKGQTDELARLRPEAQKVTADKEAMSALRSIECGYSVKESLPGGAGDEQSGSHEGERVKFDPDEKKKPAGNPTKGEMKTWEEVNEHYQHLRELVAARLAANPVLAAMDRESDEARQGAQTVATGTREEALEQIGRSLIETLDNIAKTRDLLSPTMAEDYKPVHQQLVKGKVPPSTSPRTTSGRRRPCCARPARRSSPSWAGPRRRPSSRLSGCSPCTR